MKKIGLSSKIPDAFKDLLHFPNSSVNRRLQRW
ncbi:hypothetical protein ACVXZ0_16920 [Staphylococcus aureus]